MPVLPVVCLFGKTDTNKILSPPCPNFEAREFDIKSFDDDKDFDTVLSKHRPVVIVTVGEKDSFSKVNRFFCQEKRLHFLTQSNPMEIGKAILDKIVSNVVSPRKPTVSVFTPTYKTGNKIQRPYRSMMAQTYENWEWVVFDDSDDNGKTFLELSKLAETDERIRVYKERKHSGVVGEVKKAACGVSRGDILIELDHDDEITPKAIELVVSAFHKHPEAGFVYTDFAECFENGSPCTYPNGWGFGYGSYRRETHGGVEYMVVNSPNINAKTIRHIVAAPNHIRAWRASTYREVGGHNETIHVADDYELMVRTFLHTRMVHIPVMCYVQYRNVDGNTHQTRNRDIQRLVRNISTAMDQRIHERLIELGVEDFVWQEGCPTFSRLSVPNQPVESHCTIKFVP